MIDSMPRTTLTVNQMRADQCYAYLIADPDTREAALVDPRADRVEDYLRELDARGWRLRAVIETHTHADHLSGATELRARTGAEILLSVAATSEVATGRLRDGDRVAVGGHQMQVLASPGHSLPTHYHFNQIPTRAGKPVTRHRDETASWACR